MPTDESLVMRRLVDKKHQTQTVLKSFKCLTVSVRDFWTLES